jgi:hypothetical protein
MRFGNIEYEHYTSLQADRMYLHAAQEALSRATEAWERVQKAQKEVDDLKAKIDRIEEKYKGGVHKVMEKTEDLCWWLVEDANPKLEDAYGPFVAECALVHVSCAAAAEAFINERAAGLLAGAEFDAFDKLPLDGKWLFLPRLVGKTGLDPGKRPLQGLVQVVKYRNALMHHKATREKWEIGCVAPSTLQRLGLCVDAAEKSLRATTKSMKNLSKILGEPGDRDRSVAYGFFKWQLETRPIGRPKKRRASKKTKAHRQP